VIRRRRVAKGVAILLVGLLATAFRWPAIAVLARMTDAETVGATFSTEVLDPPTALNATATLGLVVTLTWTATVDARATGYRVLRSTVNGGPYTQIATVNPRTTTTYVDLPLVPGTYYYVLRTYFGPWTSVNSNQDSAFAL
jgi:hypothetical protein